jgi:hypothetical protein
MSKSKIGSDAVQATHDCCAVPSAGRQEQLATPEGRWVGNKKPQIELLYFDGCPTHEVVRQIVSDIFRAAGVGAGVREINVTTDAQARLLKFIGSPTVRIDGRDVDPSADGAQEYGLKCRIYNTAGKLSGCPSREMIFAGLREAGYVA